MPPVTGLKRKGETWVPCVLPHCTRFLYLGSMVEGGPRTLSEVSHRISQARIRMNAHWNFFRSGHISTAHKLIAYKTYGVSVVTHGYTGWHLDKKALASLEHFDVLTQSNITGGNWDEIAHNREFILTNHIRSRRLQYLERVFEMHHTALPYKMMLALHTHLRAQSPTTRPWDGTIFMDLPNPNSLGAIEDLINDREKWCRLCSRVGLLTPTLIHSRTTRARSARLKGAGDASQRQDRAKRQRNC